MDEQGKPAGIPGLTEGRIVHYVCSEAEGFKHPGRHIPAIIVNVWDKGSGCSNLCVFLDGTNDISPAGETGLGGRPTPMTYWATSRLYSEEPNPGTWHFIEKS